MEFQIQYLAALFALPLTILGLRSLLMPKGIARDMSIEANGVAGLSTVRSVMGGLFLACVSLLALGLMSGQTIWFVSVAIVMGAVALGRAVGLLADGFDKAVIAPLGGGDSYWRWPVGNTLFDDGCLDRLN